MTTLAAVIELMHLATLVHDDAVDHSTLRRGMPTINALFSHQVSVIMGDYLYSRALRHARQGRRHRAAAHPHRRLDADDHRRDAAARVVRPAGVHRGRLLRAQSARRPRRCSPARARSARSAGPSGFRAGAAAATASCSGWRSRSPTTSSTTPNDAGGDGEADRSRPAGAQGDAAADRRAARDGAGGASARRRDVRAGRPRTTRAIAEVVGIVAESGGHRLRAAEG